MPIPLPSTWYRRKRLAWTVCFGAIILAIALTAAIPRDFVEHRIGMAILECFTLGFVVFGGIGVYLTTATCWRRSASAVELTRLRSGTHAVAVWNLRLASIARSLSFFFLAVTLISFPLLFDFSSASENWWSYRARAFGRVSPFFGVLLLTWTIGRLIRKRRALGVGLSPDGLYYWSQLGCCFYAWDWIREVHPRIAGSPYLDLTVVEPKDRGRDPEENFLGRLAWFRKRNRQIELHPLRVNPGVVYLTVVFYRRHPEHRHELSTMDGVRRIQNLDFGDLVHELETTGTLRAVADHA